MTDRDHPIVLSDEESPAPRESDSEKKLGISMLMKLALAAVVISSLVISISCLMKANQLSQQSEELMEQIEEYKEENKELKYFIDKEVDEEYIIWYARKYLNMHFPDEDVYYNDVNE